jgi:hypothetical protein
MLCEKNEKELRETPHSKILVTAQEGKLPTITKTSQSVQSVQQCLKAGATQ